LRRAERTSRHRISARRLDVSCRGAEPPRGPGDRPIMPRGLAALIAVGEALVHAQVHHETGRSCSLQQSERKGSGDLRGVPGICFGSVRPSGRAAVRFYSAGRRRHRAHRCTARARCPALIGSHFTVPAAIRGRRSAVANPAHAWGRSVEAIARIPAHSAPRTAQLRCPARAAERVSTRYLRKPGSISISAAKKPRALVRLDDAVQQGHHRRRWKQRTGSACPGTAPLTLEIRRIGDRPVGADAPAPIRSCRRPSPPRAAGRSRAPLRLPRPTDANVPIALGRAPPWPSAARRPRRRCATSPTEWYENDKGALGIVRRPCSSPRAMAEPQ